MWSGSGRSLELHTEGLHAGNVDPKKELKNTSLPGWENTSPAQYAVRLSRRPPPSCFVVASRMLCALTGVQSWVIQLQRGKHTHAYHICNYLLTLKTFQDTSLFFIMRQSVKVNFLYECWFTKLKFTIMFDVFSSNWAIFLKFAFTISPHIDIPFGSHVFY